MTPRPLADPILMEVFSNRLLSITEEMGTNLIRASFSTNIKERRDCSVGLFDAAGRLIAQAAHIPLHLGSLLGAVEAVRAIFRSPRCATATPICATTPISPPARTCRTSRS